MRIALNFLFFALAAVSVSSIAFGGSINDTSSAVPQAVSGGFGGSADAARQAGASQDKANSSSLMMAAALAAPCAMETAKGSPGISCAMMVGSLAQAKSLDGNKAGVDANRAAYSTTSSDPRDSRTSAPPGTPGSVIEPDRSTLPGQNGTLLDRAKTMAQDLKKSGFASEDGKSVTGPNGEKLSMKDLMNSAALKAAGFTDQQIADAKKALELAQNKIGGNPASASDGGGGGGTVGRAPTDDDDSKKLGFARNVSSDRKTSLAGMTTNFGGEKIGVSGDNIFEMVTRRYKARDSVDNFIK